MFVSLGKLNGATEVFIQVPAPSCHMWASIILAHVRSSKPIQAISLYLQMRRSTVEPSNHVFVAALKACAAAKDLPSGRKIHADILRSPDKPNMFVSNCLVDMYAKCGSLEEARMLFDNLPNRDVVTWTAMIAGYAQLGLGQEALTLYASMQQEGIILANCVTYLCLLQACASVAALDQGKLLHAEIRERGLEGDVVVGNCLINMYAKCSSLEDARRVFNSVAKKTVVTWNAMITGYVQQGLGHEALALYAGMQLEGICFPNAVTFLGLLQACSSVAALEKGKAIHADICKIGLQGPDLYLTNALIDMYAKCGSMVHAKQLFDALIIRDIVTWNALIAGYARQGESDITFDLFRRMRQEGMQPNGITFLSLLTVCNHVGLVEKGQEHFEDMIGECAIPPTNEHYNCIVDLLARSGQLDKAMEMVKKMHFKPKGELWRSVLAACQKWGSIELGRQVFGCAMRLDIKDARPYVLMSNIYRAAQMWDAAEEIQEMRVKAGAWKNPGQSWWTDLGGVVHTFVVEDRKHPERQHIYAELGDFFVKLEEERLGVPFRG